MITKPFKRILLIFSWGLYDLANQFFALNIVSLYYVRWITIELKTPEIFYGITYGLSNLLVGLTAPMLGTISDKRKRHRIFLILFTLISVIFTSSLGLPKSIFLSLTFFAIANFGYLMAGVFYNTLIVNIAPKSKIGLVSGIGRMLGYTGAILALYIIKPIVLRSGYKATFIPTALLFLIFSLPCMIFVKDKQSISRDGNFQLNKSPDLLNFLKASFFTLCAVNTVILFMSVYVTRVFGFNETQTINLFAFSTLFAILGSITSGYVSDYIGCKRCLNGVFILWGASFLLGALAKNAILYWVVGGVIGIALGATWVVSRALVVKLAPEERAGEVFGIFNLVGYASTLIGAMSWGLIILFSSSLGELGYRIALFTQIIFILVGIIFIRRIKMNPSSTPPA